MRAPRSILLHAIPILLMGCATGASVRVEPGAGEVLRAVETVYLSQDATPGVASRLGRIAERLAKSRRVSVTGDEETADVVAIYRQSDQLDTLRPQSTERWYWWGVVLDRDGRELASLHGEVPKEGADPADRFSRALTKVLKTGRPRP